METYHVLKIDVQPNHIVQETLGFSEQECLLWIDKYGDAVQYTIVKD